MNPRERLFARLEGKPVDRIPNLNILMQFAARELGVKYNQFCTDPKVMADANLLCAEKYGIDCVTTMSDAMKETSAFGADVVIPEDDVPYARSNLIQDEADLLKLKPTDPSRSARMNFSLETVALYKQKAGNQLPIIGWVEGCMAESADLRGVTEFLMDLATDEAFVTALMDVCLEQALLFAKAQVDAGADIIGVGDAIASVAGPVYYKKFALPYEIKLLSGIRAMGAKTKLHICGNTEPFLELLPAEYCDIIDVDWMVPLKRAVALHGTTCSLSGNYDPVAVLLQGTEEDVEKAVIDCAKDSGARYISAAGCEVPKFTPPGNLARVARTLAQM
jgi:MtaA/CmuA family methyltransferase